MIGEKDNVSEAETLIFYLGDNWIIVDFVDWVKLPISHSPPALKTRQALLATPRWSRIASAILYTRDKHRASRSQTETIRLFTDKSSFATPWLISGLWVSTYRR